jgi:hypothetical protein
MKLFSLMVLVLAQANSAAEANTSINNNLNYLTGTVDDGIKDWGVVKKHDGSVPDPVEVDPKRPFAGARLPAAADAFDFVKHYLPAKFQHLLVRRSMIQALIDGADVSKDADLAELWNELDRDTNVAHLRLLHAEHTLMQRSIENYLLAQVEAAPRRLGPAGERNKELIEQAAADSLKLQAINARINGEWDHPELVKYGALGDMMTDIGRILSGCDDAAVEATLPPDPADIILMTRTVMEAFESRCEYSSIGTSDYDTIIALANGFTNYTGNNWESGDTDWESAAIAYYNQHKPASWPAY